MTTAETHKEVIRAYAQAFSVGDFERVRALHTPDAIVRGVLGRGVIDEVISVWEELYAGLSLTLEIESLCAEGDTVAARYTERGTFRAPFRGMQPTGKSYELVVMEWYEMKDGKIHRRWGARDSAAQARQVEMG